MRNAGDLHRNLMQWGQGFRRESKREWAVPQLQCRNKAVRPAMNRRSRFVWSVRRRVVWGHHWRTLFTHAWWGV